MNLQIDKDEQERLGELLESHMRDLHPLIRRCRVSQAADELRNELAKVESLLEKVRGAGE